ncbi:hypothetical protein O9929_11490 [Vibrio lentus]|nr:hypothetical protein [Vibrio lentus]
MARLLQRLLHVDICGQSRGSGSLALRKALSGYLAVVAQVHCSADADHHHPQVRSKNHLNWLMATLAMGDKILVEEPGYRQVYKIIDLLRLS